MFSDEPLRNHATFYAAAAVLFFVALLFMSFNMGMDHQKTIGPRGSECIDGTYREPGSLGGAGFCQNGFWFRMPPEVFPVDKLEKKP